MSQKKTEVCIEVCTLTINYKIDIWIKYEKVNLMCYQSLALVILLQRKPYFGWSTGKKMKFFKKIKVKPIPQSIYFPLLLFFG